MSPLLYYLLWIFLLISQPLGNARSQSANSSYLQMPDSRPVKGVVNRLASVFNGNVHVKRATKPLVARRELDSHQWKLRKIPETAGPMETTR
jgi:hypothetical protein